MLISKVQTYLSDKMPPKKVKIKNDKKWDLANLENSFLILTFFEGILSLRQVFLFKISLNSGFFDTLYDLFQEKKFSPLRRADFKIYQHKNQKKIETPNALCLLPIVYWPVSTVYCRLSNLHCPLFTAHCPLFTAHYLLPSVYSPLSAAHCLLPVVYCPMPSVY